MIQVSFFALLFFFVSLNGVQAVETFDLEIIEEVSTSQEGELSIGILEVQSYSTFWPLLDIGKVQKEVSEELEQEE